MSNDYIIGADNRLDEVQLAELSNLGFSPPDPDGSPNHHQHLPAPVTADVVAGVMVRALTDIYRAGDADVVSLRIFPTSPMHRSS